MNAIDSLGWTHYINAFTNGHFDVVYIYWGSIDMNAKDSLGWTHLFKNSIYAVDLKL